MNFEVIGKDRCFFYLKAFKNGCMEGIYKISKCHFYSSTAENMCQYVNDLEEYVETYAPALISDNILSEIDDVEYLIVSMGVN